MFVSRELPVWWWFVVPLWPIWVFVLWALYIATRDSKEEKKMLQSVGWPEAQGQIINTKLVWSHIEVLYEFWVFAERYEGVHRIRLGPFLLGGSGTSGLQNARALREAANKTKADFPPGAKVIVRYDRSDPWDSVLYCKGEVQLPSNSPKVEPHFVTLK